MNDKHKRSIGKLCEGKFRARFDEGGADDFSLILLLEIGGVVRLYSAMALKKGKTNRTF